MKTSSLGRACPSRGLPSRAGYEVSSATRSWRDGNRFISPPRGFTQSIVAIKVVAGGVFADAEMLAHFRTEAESIARLQHPNIVQIFRVGCDRRRRFAQPRIRRSSQGQIRQQQRTRGPRRQADFVLAPASHTPFTRSNTHTTRHHSPRYFVLLHGAGARQPSATPIEILNNPKISDFGLAKQLHLNGYNRGNSHPLDGGVLGTPEYMSPEQADGSAEIGKTPSGHLRAGSHLLRITDGRVPFEGSRLSRHADCGAGRRTAAGQPLARHTARP